MRYEQGNAAAADEARALADITLRHLRRTRVTLVLVGGLPGTGKTTLAGRLADELGAVLLSSDRLRKELAGITPIDPAAAPYQHGIYTTQHTERVYAELLRRTEELLARGESVVLDASWTAQAHRDQAVAVARRTHSPLTSLCCTASNAVTAARLRSRTGSISDADPTIAAATAAAMDPWPEATVVPTDGSRDDALAGVLLALRGPMTTQIRDVLPAR